MFRRQSTGSNASADYRRFFTEEQYRMFAQEEDYRKRSLELEQYRKFVSEEHYRKLASETEQYRRLASLAAGHGRNDKAGYLWMPALHWFSRTQAKHQNSLLKLIVSVSNIELGSLCEFLAM